MAKMDLLHSHMIHVTLKPTKTPLLLSYQKKDEWVIDDDKFLNVGVIPRERWTH